MLAAKKIEMEKVPCIILEGLTEAQKKAYVIADNKMALNAGWDEELLKLELENLKELDFDLELTGFSSKEIDKIFEEEFEKNPYTSKISIPEYEIKGEQPEISTLLSETKTNELIDKINKSNVSKEQKDFLIKAAYRHYVFDYSKIAEYYVHQDEEMQNLMEDSALVIIDVDKAIVNGYATLSDELTDE